MEKISDKRSNLSSTHNAQLGLVALSHAVDPKFKSMGSRWDVPSHLYDPLTQEAVPPKKGATQSSGQDLFGLYEGEDSQKHY